MFVHGSGIIAVFVNAAIAMSGGTVVYAQGAPPPTAQQEIRPVDEAKPPRNQTDLGDENEKSRANSAGGGVVVNGLATVPVDIMVDD